MDFKEFKDYFFNDNDCYEDLQEHFLHYVETVVNVVNNDFIDINEFDMNHFPHHMYYMASLPGYRQVARFAVRYDKYTLIFIGYINMNPFSDKVNHLSMTCAIVNEEPINMDLTDCVKSADLINDLINKKDK